MIKSVCFVAVCCQLLAVTFTLDSCPETITLTDTSHIQQINYNEERLHLARFYMLHLTDPTTVYLGGPKCIHSKPDVLANGSYTATDYWTTDDGRQLSASGVFDKLSVAHNYRGYLTQSLDGSTAHRVYATIVAQPYVWASWMCNEATGKTGVMIVAYTNDASQYPDIVETTRQAVAANNLEMDGDLQSISHENCVYPGVAPAEAQN